MCEQRQGKLSALSGRDEGGSSIPDDSGAVSGAINRIRADPGVGPKSNTSHGDLSSPPACDQRLRHPQKPLANNARTGKQRPHFTETQQANVAQKMLDIKLAPVGRGRVNALHTVPRRTMAPCHALGSQCTSGVSKCCSTGNQRFGVCTQ